MKINCYHENVKRKDYNRLIFSPVNKCNTPQSFGHWGVVEKVEINKLFQNESINTATRLFRAEDSWWGLFSNYVQNKYPKGVKVFCFAASDGSEPYTIAMKLIDDLGWKKSKKYFPIISADISLEAVLRMQKRDISISNEEIEAVKKNLNQTSINDFFEMKNKDFKVKEKLFSKIEPIKADIFDEIKKIDPNGKPCVVLFRNAWYFMNSVGKNILVESLAVNLPKGSTMVIGGIEREVPPMLINRKFSKAIINGIEDKYIFEK